MAYGVKALRKIQLGKENTGGTAVPATVIWRGEGTLKDDRKVEMISEDVGLLSPTLRSHTPSLGGTLSLDDTPATFEQAPHVFESAIKLVTTGSADGSGSGKIYTYTFPTTTQNTTRSYTIQAGDNNAADQATYGYCKSFKLSGKAGDPLMLTSEWGAQQVVASSFTGSLSLETVESVLTGSGRVYIDAVSGTIGTTQVSSSVRGVNFSYEGGVGEVYTVDGNKIFTALKTKQPTAKLEVTFEHDANATIEKAAWRAETPRAVRLKFTGTTLTTAGTSYSAKTLIVDCYGKWTEFSALEDDDGNDTVTGTLTCGYDETAANFGQIVVVNTKTSL